MRTVSQSITGSVVKIPLTIHDRIYLRSYLKSKLKLHWRDELNVFAYRTKNCICWGIQNIGSGDLY